MIPDKTIGFYMLLTVIGAAIVALVMTVRWVLGS